MLPHKSPWPGWMLGALLVLAVVLAYQSVWHAGYIWDDNVILTANPAIVGPLGLKEIWTNAARETDFAPLTRTTFWLEHKLWGLAPGPYHAVNVLLHAACAVLLWRVLAALRVTGAWFGAALWALHPVAVESVAWVAEMKNTESGVFFLLAILFFVRWRRSGGNGEPSLLDRRFLAVVLFGTLAMLCKASTVILPVVLGLCAWWLERGWRWRGVLALAPLFIIGAVITLVSIWGQAAQMSAAPFQQPTPDWPTRLLSAGNAVWFYFGKLVWPYPLAAVYPPWGVDNGNIGNWRPLATLVLASALLWLMRGTNLRPLTFAFAYFFVALLPGLGLVDNTIFRYAPVFDHLQYLASMGPLALAGAALARMANALPPSLAGVRFVAAATLLLVLAMATWQRTSVYLTPLDYWTDAVLKNTASWVAHYNLGDALSAKGDMAGALGQYRIALAERPSSPAAYERIGTQFAKAGRWDESISAYREALALAPNFEEAASGLGTSLLQAGRSDEAIAAFRETLKINPRDDAAHADLGVALLQKGDADGPIAEYRAALALKPDVASTHENLAVALASKGQADEAVVEYQKALALDPRDADAHYHLGNLWLNQKRLDAAMEQYTVALQIDPDMAQAHNNLGVALMQSGRTSEAIAEFERALQLQPDFAGAQKNLALAKAAAAKAPPASAK